MRSTRLTIIGTFGVGILVAVAAADCSSSSGGGGGLGGSGGAPAATGGTTGSASGGTGPTTGTGGTTASSGGTTGGTGTGGSVTSGEGGSASGGRGVTGSGGSGTAGSGAAGGRGGRGGMVGSGGTTATGGGQGGAVTASGGAGGTPSSGTCQKGQTKGADVAILGESFYAISPQYIQNRIQDDARKAGSLGANDTYHNVAVSGQNMNYIATTEWTAATQGGAAPKYVIMDGGGIDCLTGSSCPTCASTFKTLLGKMGTAGVKDVIYTRYPEPGNPPGSNTSLKACLDSTMPGMQTACEGSTSPKCYFLDLRPVWVNGDTTDGLHPTQSGGEHVGDLIWSEMVKDCIAQ